MMELTAPFSFSRTKSINEDNCVQMGLNGVGVSGGE